MHRNALAVVAISVIWFVAWLANDSSSSPHSTSRPQAVETRAPAATAVAATRVRVAAAPSVDLPEAHENAPPSYSYDALKRRADAGDASAATRLFHALAYCIDAERLGWRSSHDVPNRLPPYQSNVLFYAMPRAAQEEALQRMTSLPGSLAWEKAADPLCKGFDSRLDNGDIYAAGLAAAQLGDHDAAACYVAGRYPVPNSWFETGAADAYGRNARRLMKEGFLRGDWRMAEMLAAAYLRRDGSRHPSAQLKMYDLEEAFRHYHLLQFGATGEHLDRIQETIDRLQDESPELDRGKASAWASDAYAKYFANSGPLPAD